MRSKKALANVTMSFCLQFVTMVCGFIVPRLILGAFGSTVNALVSSITQFLGYIVLLESGVGGVVRAALYKPLAENNTNKISAIVKSAEKFFRSVGLIFLGYSLVLAVIFPVLTNEDFDFLFTASLVLIISISSFAQYYFGISYQVLLQADQRTYIINSIQIITVVLNAVFVAVLIHFGAGIHVVKFATSAVYVLKPILLYYYTNKKHKIDHNAQRDDESIKQRWDGLGHHIAHFLHSNTDIAILTVFSSISKTFGFKEVSVYSVYYMIVSAIEKVTTIFSTGLEAAFGNMIAKNERESLLKNFKIFEFTTFTITTILFTSTALLIVPFIKLYTNGINDINYVRPGFAVLLVLAEAVYCIRIPYNSVTLAAGHYKQTRNGAFAEVIINVVISIALVAKLGLSGVAIGTLAAMTFRTVQYALYLSKNILNIKIMNFLKRVLCSAVSAGGIYLIASTIVTQNVDSYLSWAFFAIEIVLIAVIVTMAVNLIFDYSTTKMSINKIFKTLKIRR